MVNHFYVYCMDRDFGPFFLKFCTYFPYNARLCLNGHEYVKRQLDNRGIPYEALDNGILSCDNPKRVQALCDGLSGEKIDALLRKWFRKLPHPFTGKDRQAGYRYQISILQAEFSLTQVLDRPVTGRVFFEEVIRENLDMGRPSQVQLILNRRVTINNTRDFGIGKLLKNCRNCGRSAFKPTDVCWTSKPYPTIVRLAKTRSRKWSVPLKWRGNGPRL